MKTLFLAIIALVAVNAGGSAGAADTRPVYKAPPPVFIYDPWIGFYVGANGGYSWSKWDSTSLAAIFPTPTGLGTTASPNI
jgi:outer membrane immunogenic protein